MSYLENIISPLLNFAELLTNEKNEKIQIVNQVPNKSQTLLTASDLSCVLISKNNPLPLKLYFEQILFVEAKKEFERQDEGLLQKHLNEFKMRILNQINKIENSVAKISSLYNAMTPLNFLNNFSNGILSDPSTFKDSLKNVISYLAKKPFQDNQVLNRIINTLDCEPLPCLDLENILEAEINYLKNNIPNEIHYVDQHVINIDKCIPLFNGIDIHPTKDIYVASTRFGGDMVIRDLGAGKEILRMPMKDLSDGALADSYLWCPSGQYLLVATCSPACILIYNENGTFVFSIENTEYNTEGNSALWLNETMIVIGYDGGLIKLFNIEEKKQVVSFKVGKYQICGMEIFDENHLLVGDFVGDLKKINWNEKKIVWNIKSYSSNKAISNIKITSDKTNVLTGSNDAYVKCISGKDCKQKWEYKMNSSVRGLSFYAFETFIMALSREGQLVLLNVGFGHKLLEFNQLPIGCCCLRLNIRTDEVLIGEKNGYVIRLKIGYQLNHN